jgi:thioesterase domain-containing protein
MDLASKINESFGANLPLSTAFHAPTIAMLAELLAHQKAPPDWYSLIPNQRQGSRPPLFCIEVVGAEFFKSIGADQPVYSLRFGVGSPRGSILRLPKIEDLAAHYIQEIQMVQPKGPYFLVGYSWGGLVAYETALQLTERGDLVEFVVMVDTPLPNSRRQTPADRLTSPKLVEKIKYKVKSRFTIENSKSKLKKMIYGSTYYRPDTFDLATIHTVMRSYHPRAYSGRVFFFKATESPEGWKRLVGKGFEVEEISTDHAGLMRGEDVVKIARKIRAAMDRAIIRDPLAEREARERPGHGDGAVISE